jgi:hypothetical protein
LQFEVLNINEFMLYQNEELLVKSHSVVQAVSCWPVTAEAGLQSQVSPCGICGGQISTGTRFSLSTSGLSSQYYSTVAVYLPILINVNVREFNPYPANVENMVSS